LQPAARSAAGDSRSEAVNQARLLIVMTASSICCCQLLLLSYQPAAGGEAEKCRHQFETESF
jgi:hypothetical protein